MKKYELKKEMDKIIEDTFNCSYEEIISEFIEKDYDIDAVKILNKF